MSKTLIAALLITTLVIPVPGQTQREILTNTKIVELVRLGLSEALIIAKIKRSECNCDTGTEAIKKLKVARVSDPIIIAMIEKSESQFTAAGVSPSPQAPGPNGAQVISPASASPAALSDDQIQKLPQPLVLSLNRSQKTAVSPSGPTIVQSKAKGDNIGTILADAAIRDVATDAIANATVNVLMATPGIASVPIIGLAGMAIMNMPGLRRTPTITMLYALPGRESEHKLPNGMPKFEVRYGDVVGANPDDFEPRLIRVNVTPNNWRLIGAQKSKAKWFQSSDKFEFNFIEDSVPARITKLGRGHSTIEPEQPLGPGQYAVVFRPVSKTFALSYQDISFKRGEGVMVYSAWDFSIGTEHVKTVTPPPGRRENAGSERSAPPQKAVETPTPRAAIAAGLPVYGSISEIKQLRRIYIHTDDSQSRERILKELGKSPEFQVVGDPNDAEIVLEYKTLSRDSNVDDGTKDVRTRGQLSAVYVRNGSRVIAWSDTAEQARLTSGGIGFRTQHNESKLTERFVKAMRN